MAAQEEAPPPLSDEECLWLYSQALLFEQGHHAGLQIFGQMKCMFIQGYVAARTAHPQEPYQPTTTSPQRARAWYAGRDLFLRRLNPSPHFQNKKAEIDFVRCEESIAKRPYEQRT